MVRQDDYVKSQLVTAMYTYGKEYGGHLAACMIGSCLANRFRLGWGSWLEVLERAPQFAAEDLPPIKFPSVWEPNFVRLLTEVEGIYDNSGKDLSNGALYWCDLRRVTRPWFQEKILGQKDVHVVTSNMNSLTFFK